MITIEEFIHLLFCYLIGFRLIQYWEINSELRTLLQQWIVSGNQICYKIKKDLKKKKVGAHLWEMAKQHFV